MLWECMGMCVRNTDMLERPQQRCVVLGTCTDHFNNTYLLVAATYKA
jgi:hypothetical protein